LGVEDWAEIRRLHRAERLPIKEIARVMGISRNTVRSALASDAPPKYVRRPAGSALDVFEPRIRELLQAYPRMPATVIAERVGWSRGSTVFAERVGQLRPLYLPPDPAGRTNYEPGEIAQCDFWFPDIDVPVGFGHRRTAKLLPVLTMVSGYSRVASAVLIPSRGAEDLFAGWWQLIANLGAVPRVLVWDGEGAIGRWRQRQPELTRECHAFRGTLGAKVLICKPADPEAKGLVERFHDYLERSFLPGRSFASPIDFNVQLQQWLVLANSRQHRVLGCRPIDRIDADRSAMLALPPVAPVVGWRSSQRLPRDHYIRFDSNDYSVHPSVIGRRIEIHGSLDKVGVSCDGRLVADHERVWARTMSPPRGRCGENGSRSSAQPWKPTSRSVHSAITTCCSVSTAGSPDGRHPDHH
jgi:transposase